MFYCRLLTTFLIFHHSTFDPAEADKCLIAYGEVMTDFAAAERYLNRVWSASADGYIDEVNEYLEKASNQFAACLDKTNKLKLDATYQI